MLSGQKLRLNLKWVHFYRNLRGSRSASKWVGSTRNRSRRTLFEAYLRRSYDRWVERHRSHLPVIIAVGRRILYSVESESFHTTLLGSLNIPGTNEPLKSASVLQLELARIPAPPDCSGIDPLGGVLGTQTIESDNQGANAHGMLMA